MAITKSAKKALRQSLRKKTQNRRRKDDLKKVLKELDFFVAQKKTKEAKDLLSKAYKNIDKAVKIGLIKKNTAGRKKSRVARLVSKLK